MVSVGVWRCLDHIWGCLGEYRWHINHIKVVISSHCLFSKWPPINQKVHYFGVSVGCLEDVWKMSWGCLGDSGWFYNWPEQKIWGKTWRNVILVYLDFVFWVVWKVPGGCLGVSGRCLGVSGRCLEGSGGKLKHVWEVSMPNQLIKINFWPSYPSFAFSPSAQ